MLKSAGLSYGAISVNLSLRTKTCQTHSKILDKPGLTEAMAIDIIVASGRVIQITGAPPTLI
jgi:hypothetical protein